MLVQRLLTETLIRRRTRHNDLLPNKVKTNLSDNFLIFHDSLSSMIFTLSAFSALTQSLSSFYVDRFVDKEEESRAERIKWSS